MCLPTCGFMQFSNFGRHGIYSFSDPLPTDQSFISLKVYSCDAMKTRWSISWEMWCQWLIIVYDLYLAISYWIIWWYPPVSATQTSVAKCLITTHKEILHVYKTRHSGTHGYRQVTNITRTKFQHLKDSRTVLRLSVRNPLKPDVKSRMKM